ncbi:MAG: hypothetical protein WDN46_10180 [Methylocella sp.]
MGKIPLMDERVRKRFCEFHEASGLNMKEASGKAYLGDTFVRDVIKRGGGKIETVTAVVMAVNPRFLGYVMNGAGERPTPENFWSKEPESLPNHSVAALPAQTDRAAARGDRGFMINGTFHREDVLAILEGTLALIQAGQPREVVSAAAEYVLTIVEQELERSPDTDRTDNIRTLTFQTSQIFYPKEKK